MKLYVHDDDAPLSTLEVEDTMTAQAVLDLRGGQGDLWIEDADDPLDGNVCVKDALGDGRHLHHSRRCRRLTVTVRYGGDTKERVFPPAATIQRVFQWATGNKGFDLSKAERAKHELGVCGSGVIAERREHVGSLAGPDCSLCLDLAPKERFEG